MTTVWVEGVTKDMVVVKEVGRVAWEVLKLMLLNGVAKVEGRELGHKGAADAQKICCAGDSSYSAR